MTAEATGSMLCFKDAETMRSVLTIMGSIISSVTIVIVNKAIATTYHFKFMWSLTCLHFVVGTMYYYAMAKLQFFEVKPLPESKNFQLAFSSIGSIGLMNVSLSINSLGFFQLTKMMIIPCVMVIERLLFGKTPSMQVLSSIAVLLTGVVISTVSDVHINGRGLLYGIFAVLFTAQCQILTGRVQNELSLNGMQVQYHIAPVMAAGCLAVAAFAEEWGNPNVSTPLTYSYSIESVGMIVLSGFCAIAVNLASFAIVGKMGPVTYQVVGHGKTMLVLSSGVLIFGEHMPLKNLIGICIAFFGLVYYSYVKTQEGIAAKAAAEQEQKGIPLEEASKATADETEDLLQQVEDGSDVELPAPRRPASRSNLSSSQED